MKDTHHLWLVEGVQVLQWRTEKPRGRVSIDKWEWLPSLQVTGRFGKMFICRLSKTVIESQSLVLNVGLLITCYWRLIAYQHVLYLSVVPPSLLPLFDFLSSLYFLQWGWCEASEDIWTNRGQQGCHPAVVTASCVGGGGGKYKRQSDIIITPATWFSLTGTRKKKHVIPISEAHDRLGQNGSMILGNSVTSPWPAPLCVVLLLPHVSSCFPRCGTTVSCLLSHLSMISCSSAYFSSLFIFSVLLFLLLTHHFSLSSHVQTLTLLHCVFLLIWLSACPDVPNAPFVCNSCVPQSCASSCRHSRVPAFLGHVAPLSVCDRSSWFWLHLLPHLLDMFARDKWTSACCPDITDSSL